MGGFDKVSIQATICERSSWPEWIEHAALTNSQWLMSNGPPLSAGSYCSQREPVISERPPTTGTKESKREELLVSGLYCCARAR